MAENILTGLAVTADVENHPEQADELATPRGTRFALAGLLLQSAPGVPAGGVLGAPNDGDGRGPLQVDGDAGEVAYWVNAGTAVITRAGQAAYLVGNPSRVKLDAPVADGTHSRIDVVFICQPDREQSDASSQAYLDVASGSPASSPVAPSLPPGSLALAQVTVAAGAVNTTDDATFTASAPVTYANTGPVNATDILGVLSLAQLPNLPASKITSGTLTATRVPNVINLNGISYGESDPSGGVDGDIYLKLV